MSANYTQIKVWAKERGSRVTDLIMLAQQNDPFYVGTKIADEAEHRKGTAA
jgi:hypothetical protein